MIAPEPAKLLTIAGSDSGGAAGLQADLKTWTALGVYGMSVITAVTAQNSLAVSGIQYLSPTFVAAQLEAVLTDYGAQAVKTGFIGQPSLIMTIAEVLNRFEGFSLVVDPVLVDHRGSFMFNQEIIAAYRELLLPQAHLITPNWQEAALLAELPLDQTVELPFLEKIMAEFHSLGTQNILVTGFYSSTQIVDYWSDGQQLRAFSSPLINTSNDHGSGDTLSAAISAFLAQGESMGQAIVKARKYTARALRNAIQWRLGQGHGPLSHFPEN
jgi:hydroxymethylpyrimidine/phosphomethylpyrimidine kinase